MNPKGRLSFLVLSAIAVAAASAQAQNTVTGDNVSRVKVRETDVGARRFERGKWTVLGLRGVNTTDRGEEVLSTAYFAEDPFQQFTRRYWLPAGSARTTWLPVIPREKATAGEKSLDVSFSHRFSERNKKDNTPANQPASRRFSLDPSQIKTGTVYPKLRPEDLERFADASFDTEAYELIVASRLEFASNRMTINMPDHFLPPFPQSYDSLDQIIVCGDRFMDDSASLPAIRSWLATGGRMWIMLDRVSQETVLGLLGNAARLEVVGRVELNEFELKTPSVPVIRGGPVERWEAERPVDFVRVFADSAEVLSTVDDWPASFRINFGAGEVFFTTLSPRGWRYEQNRFADPRTNGIPTSGTLRALGTFASKFYRHGEVLHDMDSVRPIVQEQVGYKIPSRGLIGSVLGLNCATLIAVGVWCAQRRRLEHLAWLAPALAVATTVAMVLIGTTNTSRIPPTAVVLQIVDVTPETHEANATSLAAFFSPEGHELPLTAAFPSAVLADLADVTGTAKRAIWDDAGVSSWESVGVSPGTVRFVRARDNFPLEQPVRAVGQFGPDGFTGKLLGADAIGRLEDALVSRSTTSNMAVEFSSNDRFACTDGKIMANGQYLAGAVMTDQQQRRQAVYRHILDPSDSIHYPRRPTLFVWGNKHPRCVSVPDGFRQVRSTLFAIPLEIQRTGAQSEFVVPSPFIRMENAGGKLGTSTAFNVKTGLWTKAPTSPTDSMFRFVLPQQVMPCEIRRATITLKIHAPSREVQLTALSGGEKVTVETWQSPSGVIDISIDEARLLELDRANGLILGIHVGMTKEQADRRAYNTGQRAAPLDSSERTRGAINNSAWQIDYLRLQVAGVTK